MFTIIAALIVIGVLLWLVGMIPMDPVILNIIRAVVIVAVVLWLLGGLVGFAPRWGWR